MNGSAGSSSEIVRAMGALGEMECENLGAVGGDFELGLPGFSHLYSQ